MNAEALAEVKTIYEGSDGDKTKALYAHLESCGPTGIVALNLFRACKCSERAKLYRGSRFRNSAYERKDWSIDNLVTALSNNQTGLRWGWGVDEPRKAGGSPHFHVLYVDLPTGQVSFHNGRKIGEQAYLEPWDGLKDVSAGRIIQWCAAVLQTQKKPSAEAEG